VLVGGRKLDLIKIFEIRILGGEVGTGVRVGGSVWLEVFDRLMNGVDDD